jgi:virulence-associated protein VapD
MQITNLAELQQVRDLRARRLRNATQELMAPDAASKPCSWWESCLVDVRAYLVDLDQICEEIVDHEESR